TITQKTGCLSLLRGSLRTWYSVVHKIHRLHFLAARRVLITSCLPVMINDQIPRNFENPVLKASGIHPEILEILINPDEYLLRQVLRFISAAGVSIAQVI